MSNHEEQGKFEIGIEYNKKVAKTFWVRLPKVKDTLEVLSEKNSETSAELGLAVLAKRVKINNLPIEAHTIDLFKNMYEADYQKIKEAEARLTERLCNFSGNPEQKNNPNPSKSGV